MQRLTILDRYFLREFALGSAAAIAVLLVIFTGGTFAEIADKVASGRLPGSVLFTVLGLNLVNTLQALLPVGMFLGMLLALGRMYRDSEMHVLSASGLGPRGLLKPAALFALGAAIVAALVALWLGPWAARTANAEIEQANRSVIAAGLEAGRFTSLAGRGGILFAGSVSPDGTHLGKLFVASERPDKAGHTTISVVTANTGELFHEGKEDNRFVALHDGHRYEIRLDADNWRLMQFQRNDIALTQAADADSGEDAESVRRTRSLFGAHDDASRAELQWRLAVPFVPIVLAMLALPMARQAPRSSPVGRLLIAVLACLVMMLMMQLGRSLIAGGKLPAIVGLWWVLLPVFIGAAIVYARQYRVRHQPAAGASP